MNTEAKLDKPSAKPARRTESKEVRRQQLIDAAIESIAKNGIAGTTMSTVTETAGLSLGIVNFHFESKQNLFEETIVFLAKEHYEFWKRAHAEAGPSPSDKLLAIVDAHFHRSISTRKKLAVWYAFFGEGRRRAVYRSLIDQFDFELWDTLTLLCDEIIEDGQYNCPPGKEVARTVEALLDGMQLYILMYPETFGLTSCQKKVHAYLAAVFPKHVQMPAF